MTPQDEISAAETVTTENIVMTAGVGTELELTALADELDNGRYDPDHFPGIVYRFPQDRVTILVFRSGELVCTGAADQSLATKKIERFIEILDELGVPVEASSPSVANVVCTGKVSDGMNLNAAAIGLGLEVTEYEPEQFPGLIHRLTEPDVTLLLFGSGKCVVSGGREKADAEDAVAVIRDKLDTLGLV